jgi:hypothetical protein
VMAGLSMVCTAPAAAAGRMGKILFAGRRLQAYAMVTRRS